MSQRATRRLALELNQFGREHVDQAIESALAKLKQRLHQLDPIDESPLAGRVDAELVEFERYFRDVLRADLIAAGREWLIRNSTLAARLQRRARDAGELDRAFSDLIAKEIDRREDLIAWSLRIMRERRLEALR